MFNIGLWTGTDDCGSELVETVVGMVPVHMENNVGQWMKAVLDSTLGQLGADEVLTVEDFFRKMKAAFRENLSESPQTIPELAVCRSSDAGPSGSVSVNLMHPRDVSSVGSHMPSAFGEMTSASAACDGVAGSSLGNKPGKNF